MKRQRPLVHELKMEQGEMMFKSNIWCVLVISTKMIPNSSRCHNEQCELNQVLSSIQYRDSRQLLSQWFKQSKLQKPPALLVLEKPLPALQYDDEVHFGIIFSFPWHCKWYVKYMNLNDKPLYSIITVNAIDCYECLNCDDADDATEKSCSSSLYDSCYKVTACKF